MKHYTASDLDEFVSNCHLNYSSRGIEVGDPSHEWHLAHHPVPKWLNGVDLVPLLAKDHAIHGVIQSEVFYYPCISAKPWERPYLPKEYLDLYDKWKSELGKLGGNMNTPTQQQTRVKNGKRTAERGLGVHSPENRKRVAEGQLGIYSPEVRSKASERGKSTNTQRWMCLVTGFITNPGNLSQYQKRRGIDTSRRVRLTPEESAFIFLWE